ncbi:toxin-activating lysine-acyltransferase [Ciceribacter sp. RN22]|uniref:toxin-activating lysine-acyltransferase n=1 Tax=Ciceribacter sp. RN22 TaxID=2954932 RepID=UPI00209217F9|nr:toxin-activating lysine-acyltransferase [Ciceribacter sp. RN22]
MGLYQASERHRNATVTEFASMVLPAIHFNQFRIYHDAKGRAVGWISWAYMTAEEGQGYMAGNFDFGTETWIGGEHLWFIDFIAPYGHALKIAADLRTNVFPDQIGFAPDLEAVDGSRRVRRFLGASVKGVDTKEANSDFLNSISR